MVVHYMSLKSQEVMSTGKCHQALITQTGAKLFIWSQIEKVKTWVKCDTTYTKDITTLID